MTFTLSPAQQYERIAAAPARFIDTHLHLWNEDNGFDYSWLDGSDDGDLGRVSEIRFRQWDARRFDDETRFVRPAAVVHVQATNEPTDSVDETAWLAAQALAGRSPMVIVARAELRSPALAHEVERHRAAAPQLRGVRDMSTMGSLRDDAIVAGLALLEEAGLSWEASSTWQEMDRLGEIASMRPGLSIVLGHAGWPAEGGAAYFARWSEALHRLAAAPNVVCKVSGLGMSDHVWSPESRRPWIEACLSAFGADRCMFGSNWPVDRIYSSYEAQLLAVSHIVSGLSSTEADDFWYSTAFRTYNLSTEGIPS